MIDRITSVGVSTWKWRGSQLALIFLVLRPHIATQGPEYRHTRWSWPTVVITERKLDEAGVGVV